MEVSFGQLLPEGIMRAVVFYKTVASLLMVMKYLSFVKVACLVRRAVVLSIRYAVIMYMYHANITCNKF